eukprot:528527-Rhodomonas_salina.1
MHSQPGASARLPQRPEDALHRRATETCSLAATWSGVRPRWSVAATSFSLAACPRQHTPARQRQERASEVGGGKARDGERSR